MSGTDPFSDSWYSMEFGQTNPFPGQDLVPTVPSQMAASRWYPPPLARRGPATPLPDVADTGFPPPGKNTPFDFHHRGGPPFCLEGSPPFVFHSRFHPEGISLPHTIDPRTLLSSTMSVINGPTVERSQAHISETPPIQDSPANGSANAAKSVRFLRMRSKHRYECSWDDGSGKICGYSGTLLEAKRHVQRVHPSNRSVMCWVCNKVLSSAYYLRLHMNQHTGETPFKCQGCENAFKNPNALRNHRIDHHGYIPKKRRQGGKGQPKETVDNSRI